ncbi:MAG: hypothetical protein J2P28_10010 [Actinobacteria bacterium]|nr:hypothetical protein [Actinomycetota bacterium]
MLVAEQGQVEIGSASRAALLVSVPALSLLLPGLAVAIADGGGTGELTRVAAAVSKFLLFYSGVFALIALSAAVAAGLLATDRILMTPETRILAHTAHRTVSLLGVSALANHIMLEIIANRAGVADSMIPFLSSRATFFMGLGTLSSNLFVVIIMTGVLRRRFSTGSRPRLWRILHVSAYAAWPMAVLHGLLAGRSAKPYVDWSYGACLAFAALFLTARYVLKNRGRSGAPAGAAGRAGPSWTSMPMAIPTVPTAPPALPDPRSRIAQTRAVAATRWPRSAIESGPLRALPSGEPPAPRSGHPSGPLPAPGPRPRSPRGTGARWTEPPIADADDRFGPVEHPRAGRSGSYPGPRHRRATGQDDWEPDHASYSDRDSYPVPQEDWAEPQDDWADQHDWADPQDDWADPLDVPPRGQHRRTADPDAWPPRPDESGWR